jgi:hypothetical protein
MAIVKGRFVASDTLSRWGILGLHVVEGLIDSHAITRTPPPPSLFSTPTAFFSAVFHVQSPMILELPGIILSISYMPEADYFSKCDASVL